MSKSIEELLKLVNERPKKEKRNKEDHRDVLEFIKELNIESGTQAVPTYLIFYFYRSLWNPENTKRKAKKITFFQTFGRYFNDFRKNTQRYYLLKDGLFNVTEDVIKAAKQYDKQHWQSKKTQKKVSASEQEWGENT